MKVTGFTFIRNAVKYDFPIVQAITSILPLCTDFVVALGKSEDNTGALIRGINSPKIRIVETTWDEKLRSGGKVLAAETAKAMQAIKPDADWCFYIQGDEVIHEQYLENIRLAMERYKDDKAIDGLLLKYLHFYGSYDHVGTSPSLYKKEIRIIKNDKSIYSYRDAQGFRKGKNRKLRVKEIDAFVFHYGYVKDPKAMQRKHEDFGKLWNNDESITKNSTSVAEFDYKKSKPPLAVFEGTHPKVMEDKIRQKNWLFIGDTSATKYTLKQKLKIILEDKLGLNLSYNNYRIT